MQEISNVVYLPKHESSIFQKNKNGQFEESKNVREKQDTNSIHRKKTEELC